MRLNLFSLTSSSSEEGEEEMMASSPEPGQCSTSFNLVKHEFRLTVCTQTVVRIKSRIHSFSDHPEPAPGPLLDQVLEPARAEVDAALRNVQPRRVVTDYFDGSERSSRLCLLIHRSIRSTRDLYSPLCTLLDDLPESQRSVLNPQKCDDALQIFVLFISHENPFKGSTDSLGTLRHQLGELSRQLNSMSAPPVCCQVGFWRREMRAQMEKAMKGIFVLGGYLETMERLVRLLYDSVESDRDWVKKGLRIGGEDNSFVVVVLSALKQSVQPLMKKLSEMEDHVCVFLDDINGARKLLFEHFWRH